MTKQLVIKPVGTIDIDFSTLRNASDQINDYIKKYGETATIEIGYQMYDDFLTVTVFVEREETDEEYACRLSMEEVAQKREYQNYLRLKEKYEPAKSS